MHLVLRSSKAKGEWSFLRSRNSTVIKTIVGKFAFIYGIQILSLVNVGNHLHLHIRLGNRFGYSPFIRAITGAIAMAVAGKNRWSKSAVGPGSAQLAKAKADRFWDHRPFTRVVAGYQAAQGLVDYLRINEMESWGFNKFEARSMFEIERKLRRGIPTWGAW